MSLTRSAFFKWAAAGAVAAGALFTATSASAGNVNWSVGIHTPAVVVGVGGPPVYYAPPPVYYAPPPPVYYRPAPVYYGPPAPVYYRQPHGYYRHHYYRGHGHRHGHGHGHRHGHWR